jgi:hypothetical protein
LRKDEKAMIVIGNFIAWHRRTMKNKQISVGVEPNNYELEVTAANF